MYSHSRMQTTSKLLSAKISTVCKCQCEMSTSKEREGMNNPDVLPLLLSFHLCLPEGSSGFHYSKEGNANTLPPSDRAEKKAAICGDIFGYLSKVFPRSSNYFRKGRIYLLLLVLCLTKKCLLALPAFLQINLIHSPRCCVVEYCIKRLSLHNAQRNESNDLFQIFLKAIVPSSSTTSCNKSRCK